MKRHLLTMTISFLLMISSNLFSQHYADVFKRDQMGNLSLFIKNGFSVEKKPDGKYTESVTYAKESIDNGDTHFLRYSILYGEDSKPKTLVITTNDVSIYESLLKHCREKNMNRYFNSEDESAKYDICYVNTDFAISFKSDLSDRVKIYSITFVE